MTRTQANPADTSLLIMALRQQLGLVLKPEKATVDVLVIDSAEKVLAETNRSMRDTREHMQTWTNKKGDA